MAALALVLLHQWAVVAGAATPAGYTEYIIPFDEDVFVYVTDPVAFDAIPADRPTSSIISLTIWSNDTTVYVDHWENGYSFDPSDPDNTADEKYTAGFGETLNFVSTAIPRPRTGPDGNTYVGATGDCDPQAPPRTADFRRTTTYCYDGRDYVYAAGGATTMTRGGWIQGSGGNTLGPRAAIGEEVYPLAPQLIRYILPFGEGIGGSSYERVIAVVQATEDDTELRIDFQGDGIFDSFNTENGYRDARVDPVDATFVTLQRGETYVLDRDSDGIGGTLDKDVIILGTKTLQVEYFYGEDDGNYDTRAIAAYPRGFWGDKYYAPVDGAPGADTDIFLYNPDLTNAITIDWRTTVGSGSFSLAAQESALFQARTGAYVPEGSAVYMSGTDTFWGFSDVDVNSAAYDWGYSLVPDYLLEDEQTVAYAPGNIENDDAVDFMPCNFAEGRDDGIFVTPAFDNTTFFIDKDGDGVPDVDASMEVLLGVTPVAATASNGYVADRLESLYITGSNVGTTAASDCNLTGSRIWATGPFTMAYGENPQKASGAGGMDLGYTVLPNPGDWMDLVLTVDKTTDPVVLSTTAGAVATFTLEVNSHELDVDAVSVVDTLPPNWAYVSGSTTITLTDLTQISGAAADPALALPTLTWSSVTLGSLLPNQRITISFQAQTTANFNNGDLTRNLVEATGTRTVGGVTQTFRARDFVFNTYQDATVSLGITKTSSVPEPTPVSPGDTLTYTVVVSNPLSSTVPLTNLWIDDPLPVGVSYVPASGQVVGCIGFENVRDEFGSISYSNDDGSQNWSGAWAETDTFGGGASAGSLLVTNDALRLDYFDAFGRDEFNTAGSATANDGSVNWSTNWTENDPGSSGFTNGDIEIEQGRLEFQNSTDGGEYAQRSLTVTGATSATISFDWDNNGLDGNDDIIVEYSLDGGAFATAFIQDGNDADGFYTTTVGFAGVTTLTLRIRAEDGLENPPGGGSAEEARFDNVQVSHNGGGAPAANDRAARSVDLSSATSATLTFASATSGTLDAGDVVEVRVNTTNSFAGSILLESVANDNAFLGTYDLTPYMSANTTVFFVVASGIDAVDEWRSFDDVDITYTAALPSFASGNPPDFLDSATGCSVTPGSSATLTFDVTVDDPFPTGQNEIINAAWSAATEIPVPQSASARNIVIVPSAGSATVGDRVWLDADADGVLDPGEAGLAGVEVTLEDVWGTPLQVTTTDSQGRYLFIDVQPGNGYFVEVTGGLPAGLTQTTDGRTDERTNDFDLVSGQTDLDADIGFRASPTTASIGDTVWIDVDQDQFRDPGEVGLSGVTVELYEDTDGDGLGDVLLSSQVTGSGGAYLLTGIPANGALDYVVTLQPGQAALAGYTATTVTNYPYADLPSGATRVDADFGFVPGAGTTFTISEGIWLDDGAGGGTASNGVKDGTEAGIPGVTVSLLDSSSNVIASTTSDAAGNFTFTGIPANQNYRWRITDDDHVLADLFGTTSFAQAGREQLVGSLTADVDHTADPHFGYNSSRAIGDTVWNDLDGNGVQNGTEPGIAGVTVLLYRDVDSDGVFEPGGDDGGSIGSVVTSGTGFYLFTGLADGPYFVSIDETQSSLSGFDSLTTGDQEAAAGHQRQATLAGGVSQLDEDYGYRATTSFELSGRLWNDANDNGADDAEPGFESVTLELVSGGNVIATTSSAADGSYSFQGLPNGTCTVRFTDVNGVLTGFDTTYEKTEGALAGSYDGLEVATIAGASITDLDFGFYNPFRPLTLAIVSSFTAHDESGSVVIEWQTSAEVGTIGFDLYRFDGAETGYVMLNEELLPALIGSQQGGTYRFVDEGASTGRSLWYLLVEVEDSGRRNPLGPYQVNTGSTLYSGGSQARRAALGQRLTRGFARTRRVTRPGPETRQIPGLPYHFRPRPTGERRRQVKIATREAGIYFLPRVDAETAGFERLSGAGGLSLRHGGSNVAYATAADRSGVFFYAPRPSGESVSRDVYWLGGRRGFPARMEGRSDATARPAGDETFRRAVRMEQDLLPSPQLFSDPDGDWTLWDYMFGGWGARLFSFRADGVVAHGSAALTLRLHGGNDTEVDPDHHVALRLNGQPIGEISWDGLNPSVTTHEFAASLLVDGDNTLEIEALADTGAWYSLVYLDSFEVTYDSLYRARDNRLECSTGANRAIRISGFTRSDIMVFDVTDARRPVQVAGRVSELADGSYGVALSAPAPETLYYALTPDAALRGDVSPDIPSSLRSERNAAEYLVITTSQLRETAQALADYRGMSSLVVDIEDVYDEFNDGVPSPRALGAFLAHAAGNWAVPPRYVVLAGTGSFDYAASYPYGDNLIPPMMVPTPDGLAPSDVWFADLDRAGAAPELAIGRLPASTPGQLQEMIRKIQAREELGGGWLRRFLVAADNPDTAGAFPTDSERLVALTPAGFDIERVYLSSLPAATARERLLAGINSGAGMVSYVGHAGYDVLADEGLLRSADLGLLLNHDRPAVLTAMTCLAGNFASPFIPSLGEQLVQQPGGGAVAVWAPTWLSENDHAVVLAEAYYARVFAGGEVRIGDAIVSAMHSYEQTWRPRYLLSIYTLLGDPALRVEW